MTELGVGALKDGCLLFRYRLIDGNGSDLGPLVSSSDWLVGGLINSVDGYMRIAAVVEPETEESFRASLVVEPIEIGQ